MAFGFFFTPFTLYSFRAEAINKLFTIKTKDKSIITRQNKLRLTFLNKVRIIIGCPTKKLKRLLETYYKGHNYLLRELDMVRMCKEITYLKELTKSLDP